jgi:uncharacterized protein (DUF488 family)
MKTAYLTGYTGKPTRTPAQLLQLAINLEATVVDIRYSPRSRVPHWNQDALKDKLGSRYSLVGAFGNRAFKSGMIHLVNPPAGLNFLYHRPERRFILLCACNDGETCHRKQVGEYLAAHGWEVREVTKQEWEEVR